MPPVLGPRSPSSRRLWSCEVASGRTCSPSAITMKLASSPCEEFLDHDLVRRPRRSWPANMACAPPRWPPRASCAMTTPLPAASPSALTTSGRALRGAPSAASKLARVNVAVARGRDPVAAQELLGEGLGALELRRRAARAEAAQAARREAIDDAGHERRLGPDDGEVDALALRPASAGRRCPRRRPSTLRTFGSRAVPALPGATSTSADARRLRRTSRPARARGRRRRRSSTFIASVPEVAHAGEHHRHAVLVGGGDHLGVAHASRRAG